MSEVIKPTEEQEEILAVFPKENLSKLVHSQDQEKQVH